MNDVAKHTLTKVPAVTLGFWVIKILATTLGETGGDAVTMTIFHADTLKNWGYLIGVALFGGALVALVAGRRRQLIALLPLHDLPSARGDVLDVAAGQ